MAKPKQHYVDNKEFYAALVERHALVQDCIAREAEPPLITDYLGKCIYDICTHLSYKPNFINYSFRQEMISDALENCIAVIDKFNTEEYKNPFSYFTQIAFFAFLRRIDMEKKQQYFKFKLLEEVDMDEMVEVHDHDSGESHYRSAVDFARENSYFNTLEYEQKRDAKKQAAVKTPIENALDAD